MKDDTRTDRETLTNGQIEGQKRQKDRQTERKPDRRTARWTDRLREINNHTDKPADKQAKSKEGGMRGQTERGMGEVSRVKGINEKSQKRISYFRVCFEKVTRPELQRAPSPSRGRLGDTWWWQNLISRRRMKNGGKWNSWMQKWLRWDGVTFIWRARVKGWFSGWLAERSYEIWSNLAI